MTFQSHFMMAVAAQFAATTGWPLKTRVIACVLAAFGGVLPDIDHPKSWIGRFVPVIPEALYATTGHRGATHGLLAAISAAAVVGVSLHLAGLDWMLAQAVLLGYLIHLAGDFVTNRGIPMFWPLKQRIGISIANTGTLSELAVSIGFSAALIAIVLV